MKRKKKNAEEFPSSSAQKNSFEDSFEDESPKKKKRQPKKRLFNIEDKNLANMKKCELNKPLEINNSEELSDKDLKSEKGKQTERLKSLLLRPPATFNEEGKRVFYKGERATMCHQCQRNDKGRVVHCTICKTKRFCIPCMISWYPLLSEVEIAEKCPACRGNCNCKSCLRIGNKMVPEINVSRENEVNYAFHILKYLYPWFKTFYANHLSETEYEAKIKGIDTSELVISKAKLKLDENIHCNKCNSLIVDLHRSCKICSYILCLNCSHNFEPSNNENPPPVILCSNPNKKHKKALELKSFFGQTFVSQLFEKLTEITAQNNPNFSNSKDASEELNSESTLDCLYSPVEKEGRMRHFQKRWCKGKPVVVRDMRDGFKDSLSWEPMVMWRALRDFKLKDLNDVNALDCRDLSNVKLGIRTFLTGYTDGQSHYDNWPQLLQLIDFPPASSFNQRLPRHLADIITSLPLKEFTHPNGSLNLIGKLGGLNDNNNSSIKNNNYKDKDKNKKKKKIYDDDNNNLMRPRMCISYGTKEELFEGDSVTKIQCRMTDVVNIMTHVYEVTLTREQIRAVEKRQNQKNSNKKMESKNGNDLKSKEDYGGALWDIWRREDVLKLKEYLIKHASEFVRYDNEPVLMVDDEPIRGDCFYLNMEHKKKLKEEYGIEAWTFEQKLGEAVFIPAGCPYQVRNLKSCIKVAIDFISPESFSECINMSEEFRVEKDYNKSELEKMAIYALKKALDGFEGVNNKLEMDVRKSKTRPRSKRCERRRTKRGYIYVEEISYEKPKKVDGEINNHEKPKGAENIDCEMNHHESYPNSEREENEIAALDSEREENDMMAPNSEGKENDITDPNMERKENEITALNSERKENEITALNSERKENEITALNSERKENEITALNSERKENEITALNSERKENEITVQYLYWSERHRAFLIELLWSFNSPNHRDFNGWKETCWIEILKHFKKEFPLANFQIEQLIEEEQELEKAYREIKWLLDRCGFEWDFDTKKVTGPQYDDDDVMKYLFEMNPLAKKWHGKIFLYYDDLSPLYEGFIIEEPEMNEDAGVEVMDESIESNLSFQVREFLLSEISMQYVENEPWFIQNNLSIQPPNSSQLEEVSPQIIQEPNFSPNNLSIQLPDFPQTEISQTVENEPPPGFVPSNPKPNSTQNNSSDKAPDFLQTETSQNSENEPSKVEFISSEPNFTRNNLPIEASDFAQVEMSPENDENEHLHRKHVICSEPNSLNFTLNNLPIQTLDFPQDEISLENIENEPLHVNSTPSSQNNSSFEPLDFQLQSVENESLNSDPIPSNQESSYTQIDSSIKTRVFSRVEASTRIMVPQQEFSVHETSKWKGVESERSETNNYVNTMELMEEISRMRLELECKRFDLEMKYSFKNAMDIFDSLDGFSFEDYDKVSELFLRDEKIRNAFIDVKEEYKVRWISSRI